jgi:hypothetical protein
MATITQPPVNRKPRTFEPVQGVFTWVSPWDGTTGRLVISTRTGAAVYTVSAIRTEGGVHFGGLVAGYELINEGSGEVYALALEPFGLTCECWDFLLRDRYATTPETRYCKHIVALQAALPHEHAA